MCFNKIHQCGHIDENVRDGKLDLRPFLRQANLDLLSLSGSEAITSTRDLPGFVLGNVTYESHRFWVHFLNFTWGGDSIGERYSGCLVVVNHGGGWEVYRGDYMMAEALSRFGDDDKGLFLLCWAMFDAARENREVGKIETVREYRQAFVDGRLKKRKQRGSTFYKVWIEKEA